MIETVKFSELKIGDKGEVTKTITEEDINKFVEISGDDNPIHVDIEFAKNTPFKERIVHGMLVSSLISAVVGTKMPGPGSIWLDQTLRFLRPVKINDEITATSEILIKIEERRQVIVRTTCTNQRGEVVIEGQGIHKIINP